MKKQICILTILFVLMLAGSASASPAPDVPIPSTVWLLVSGLIGLVGFKNKFRK